MTDQTPRVIACETCKYWEPGEGEKDIGVCGVLSRLGGTVSTFIDSASRATLHCSKHFGCTLHESKEGE